MSPYRVSVSNKHIYVGYNLRYHPFIKFIKELMKEEKILRIVFKRSWTISTRLATETNNKTYSSDKQKGGGVLLELSHEIDYMLLLFGKCIDNYSFSRYKLSELEINSDYNNKICRKTIFKFEHWQTIIV